MKDVEAKNIIEALLRGFMKVFTATFFQEKLDNYVQKKYDEGLIKAEDLFQINFTRDDQNLNNLRQYVAGNVGNTAEEINQSLRQEIQRAQLDGVDLKQLKQRVKQVFKDQKYMNRLKTVIRTEGNRAGNYGQLDGAKQSGLKLKKYLDVSVDQRTSDICMAEHKKYGTPEQAIPLDKLFTVKVRNKTFQGDAPPFHPNCRTIIMFTEV